jgi:hypothetical protein
MKTLRDIPFTAGAPEHFEAAFGGGHFRGRFRRGTSAAAATLVADMPESNKSKACVRAGVATPPPMEAEDVFPPLIFMVVEEDFSVTLSPEDCETIFLLYFTGLASANSCADI